MTEIKSGKSMNTISILLVDDEIKIAQRLARILKRDGYEVETCANGDEAINKLAGKKYDIMMTDLNMPVVDGFELLEHIHNNEIDILPLIFTGYASVEGAIRALKLGAYDFIQKPVDSETLKHTVKRAANHIILTRENEKNIIKLEKLNKLKDEFLAVVSHDLRSPLSSIGGYVRYLLKKGDLNEQQTRYLNVIKEISDQTYGLVNELLDISKIEKGVIDLNKEHTDIEELINTSINNFLLLGIDKNNKIHFFNKLENTKVKIDKMKTLQVFNNLINNAIKFTENGEISINLEAVNNEDSTEDKIKISIQDSGIGMTGEEIKTLFNQYGYKFKSGTRGEKGNGLGLIICKKFVELHNGEINVKSIINEGTTFEIILPRE